MTQSRSVRLSGKARDYQRDVAVQECLLIWAASQDGLLTGAAAQFCRFSWTAKKHQGNAITDLARENLKKKRQPGVFTRRKACQTADL